MHRMRAWYRRFAGDENGNALLGALLILLVMSAMGAAFVSLSKTETVIAGNEKRHVQSMFNAEAGVSEALVRMSSTDTSLYFGEDLASGPPTPGWGRYVVLESGNRMRDPRVGATATDSLDNDADGTIDESGEMFAEVLTEQAGEDAVDYPWVRVQYRLNAMNQVVLYGDHDNNPTTDPRPNLARGWPILRVSAEGNQGAAERRIAVEAVKAPFTAPKAAIYAESDDFQFNGTQFLVSGKDWNPVTGDTLAGAPQVNGIETTGDPAVIAGELHNNQLNNVEGDGAEPSIRPASADYDLQAMIDQYAPMADDVHPGGTIANGTIPDWGGWEDYRIVHVTADLHISGDVSGGGLLLLQGDLTCSGQFTWYGLVINVGTIAFSGGGNEIHIYGALMTTGGVSTNAVGGNADVLYSSMALSKLSAFNPYRVSAWTELP